MCVSIYLCVCAWVYKCVFALKIQEDISRELTVLPRGGDHAGIQGVQPSLAMLAVYNCCQF